MKIALAQIDPLIGDFDGNVDRMLRVAEDARARGAELVCFPELAICGYPPRDLLERAGFVAQNLAALERFAARAPIAAVAGFVDRNREPVGKRLHNAAAAIDGGRIVSIHHKALLPTYDVFDEHRHFEPATALRLASIRGRRVAVTICEDAWNDPEFWPERLYPRDPVAELCAAGAEFVVNISASPFTLDKRALRPRMLAAHARKHGRPLVFVNQIGGQDDLVFDGHSLAIDSHGETIARGAEFEEDLVLVDLDAPGGPRGDVHPIAGDDVDAALRALVLGTRDYAAKCGFRGVVLGLSGGIDSSLVACVAARAIGADRVLGVAMPTRYSSEGSLRDAEALARNLGIDFRVIPIDPLFEGFLRTLAPTFAGLSPDVTEENLQARIRGTVLMALSNKLSRLLLTTGNKSELGVGYCTLYGDMCGGLAVISDVPKTLVYRIAEQVNRERAVIPPEVFTKAPSAELRANQTDQDTLPPYDVLDPILEAHIERGLDRDALIEAGFDPRIAADTVARAARGEYKRRQAPPGLKITSKAFGYGRRFPIAHR
ncbi:MAG: NAD+ synthase, partial [Myxococcota bacterium]